MIKSIQILVIVFISTNFIFADKLQEKFQNGNKLYQQENYEQAISEYQDILSAGQESGALYFNLGNAYYKLNRFGLARLNYERALLLLKNDEALNDNLNLLRQSLVDKIPQPPQFILFSWRDAVMNLFGLNLLTWLSAGLFLLLLLLNGWHRHNLRRAQVSHVRGARLTVIILFLMIVLIYAQKIYLLETEEFGIIQTPSVTIYAEPKNSAVEVFVLHEGAKVKIERYAQDWLEIKIADGKTGWLQKSNLEKI